MLKVVGVLIKAALIVIVVTIVFVVLGLGFAALNLNVIGPWQHARNTSNAEALNDTIWRSDVAEIFSIEVRFNIDGLDRIAVTELICARKVTTETISLKGGPYKSDQVLNIGNQTFRFPVSGDYEVELQLPKSCGRLEEFQNGASAPLVPADYYARIVVVRQLLPPNNACNQVIYDGGTQFGTLHVFSPTIQSKRTTRIKNVVTREEFGPADRAIIRENRRLSGKYRSLTNNKTRGERDESCWASWGI